MVIDTSAIIAILLDEPEAEAFARKIKESSERLVSAASLLEASIVLESRKGAESAQALDVFIYRTAIRIVPFDERQAELARAAWRRFGKGRHRAALNYADCMVYALAKATDSNLLYKGGDFALTDAVPA